MTCVCVCGAVGFLGSVGPYLFVRCLGFGHSREKEIKKMAYSLHISEWDALGQADSEGWSNAPHKTLQGKGSVHISRC